MDRTAFRWAAGKVTGDVGAKLVLVILAHLADMGDGRTCQPTIAEIAEMAELSERSVRRKLLALSDSGHVAIEACFARDGTQLPNRYLLQR